MAINPAQQGGNVFLGGLARRLAADGLLSEQAAREFQVRALREGIPFVQLVVEAKAAKPAAVAEIASAEFGVPLLDLAALEIDPSVIKEVTEKILRKAHALPIFKRGKKTYVAVSDPTNLQALDERIEELDREIEQIARQDPAAMRLQQVRGIGPLTATALLATVGDASQFSNGREMAASFGLTPKQNSS